MYVNTTGTQLTRAISMWVFVVGAVLFPLVARDLTKWNHPGSLLAVLALLGGGGGTWFWSMRRISALDDLNRPYLLSEAGPGVLGARLDFERRVTTFKRCALALFLVCGTVFITLVSARNCDNRSRGFCAVAPDPGDPLLVLVQVTALALGALYVSGVVLSRTHINETERIEAVIAEGQRQRRDDGPLTGIRRGGWE